MIDVRNLSKSYGSFAAVKDVSFDVKKGEIVGLLGPNGAGKTSIMKVLTGYHFPSGGTALVMGHDVAEEPIEAKKSVGYLPESAPVYGEFTVKEYLGFVADARMIPKAERRKALERVVEDCGLESVANRRIERLSKGFRQRTGLAQALIHDPPVLILDEPTTGLDPNQILEIRRLIKRLGGEKTVIFSTHILQEVEAVSDRVLILNEGRIAAEGTREEIAARLKGDERYAVIVKSPDPVAEADFSGLPGFRKLLKAEAREDGRTEVLVSFDPGRDGGESIFDLAVVRGWKLAELTRESFSLEDIFIRLTREGGNDA